MSSVGVGVWFFFGTDWEAAGILDTQSRVRVENSGWGHTIAHSRQGLHSWLGAGRRVFEAAAANANANAQCALCSVWSSICMVGWSRNWSHAIVVLAETWGWGLTFGFDDWGLDVAG
ncbi:hypothetical protein VTL71DRAFT_3938 [Oculimacula yallundae]|uniref:Uncharacterized protein n=1 Tax=Oculimacula yallundae TaxID=86028 RepID=A0ABR4C4E6_9HELO